MGKPFPAGTSRSMVMVAAPFGMARKETAGSRTSVPPSYFDECIVNLRREQAHMYVNDWCYTG